MRRAGRPATLAAAAVAMATLAALAGCGSGSAATQNGKVVLRLGFLTNVTHAPALIGVAKGIFAKDLGAGVTLQPVPFSSGTEEATALLAGQLDAAYVGPNPAIKAWQTSGGKLIRVISGAASGGASLVVKAGITSVAQLKGQKLATPSLGNTQDVALRYWLSQNHLTSTATGGGDVPITPIKPNSAAVLQFKSGQIAGAWEPAPYDIQMVAAGGHVLVNEASLWPGGKFVTTNLVVTQKFLAAHPKVVSGLLQGQIDANTLIHTDPAAAQAAVNSELTALIGKGLKASLLAKAFAEIEFTNDPVASSLAADAEHAVAVGLLKPVNDIQALYDLAPLNKLLTAAGQAAITS